MKVLINLAPLKAGGGQNVGMNLISGLQNLNSPDTILYFYVSANSLISDKVKQIYSERIIEGPHNTVNRILFERTHLEKYILKN